MKQALATINLFSGVGGIEKGFSNAGFPALLGTDFDPYAGRTYVMNHENLFILDDVARISADRILRELADFHTGSARQWDLASIEGGILTGGFPCQPFSVAGYRRGFEDERGNVFWEILRLIDELNPEVVFLENVKNLRQHDEGRTFKTIESALKGEISSPEGVRLRHGYSVKTAVLNSKDFGIPQNRERIYIVAFRDHIRASRFSFPQGVDFAKGNEWPLDGVSAQKYFYQADSHLYPKLVGEVTSPGTFYQWRRQYVRANKSNLCPTLTANMGMGGHNVPIVLDGGKIRKLTPRECFRLMGYEGISIPEELSDSRLYKQAGNSVVVPVVESIARQIAEAIG